jgi:hypothetical protein
VKKKQFNLVFKVLVLFIAAQTATAQTINFDIGTAQWTGTFPGPGTYSQTQSNVQVTAAADLIVNITTDPTAVYAGNDSPAINRTFSYTFPQNSTVSIDFFQLTLNSSNLPESIGNFSAIPDAVNLGDGHNIIGLDYRLEGSNLANINTTSTLTWNNIDSLSFDIASNGNVALIGHRNLVVSIPATPVPALSIGSLVLLTLGLLAAFTAFNRYNKGISHV